MDCEKCEYGKLIAIIVAMGIFILFSIGNDIKRGHHYATN